MTQSIENGRFVHYLCPECVKWGFARDPRQKDPNVEVEDLLCSTHRLVEYEQGQAEETTPPK